MSTSILKTVYFSFIHSQLTYAILVWGHAPQASRLFALQRRAVRTITRIGYREDCKHQFVKLGILTLPCLYIFQCLIYIHNHAENYCVQAELHNYNTRNKNNIRYDFTRLKTSRNSINYYAIRFFNLLPLEFRTQSANTFQKSLKKYLIARAFYSIDEYLANNFDDL